MENVAARWRLSACSHHNCGNGLLHLLRIMTSGSSDVFFPDTHLYEMLVKIGKGVKFK